MHVMRSCPRDMGFKQEQITTQYLLHEKRWRVLVPRVGSVGNKRVRAEEHFKQVQSLLVEAPHASPQHYHDERLPSQL
jgi:hypothetical protein